MKEYFGLADIRTHILYTEKLWKTTQPSIINNYLPLVGYFQVFTWYTFIPFKFLKWLLLFKIKDKVQWLKKNLFNM